MKLLNTDLYRILPEESGKVNRKHWIEKMAKLIKKKEKKDYFYYQHVVLVLR